MGDITLRFSKEYDIYLVAEDNDLYQLLLDGVYMYSPKTRRLFSGRSFKEKYKIDPDKWSMVKSIMGCAGDEVPGVPGIGPGRAIAYLNGELKKTSNHYKAIEKNWGLIKRNIELVHLPHHGTPETKLYEDEVTLDKFIDFCQTNSLWGISKVDKRKIWKEILCNG